jgi:hypothetical protein
VGKRFRGRYERQLARLGVRGGLCFDFGVCDFYGAETWEAGVVKHLSRIKGCERDAIDKLRYDSMVFFPNSKNERSYL